MYCPLDDARSANDVIESVEPAETPPATEKAKGLSKVLGQCLGKSQSMLTAYPSPTGEARTRRICT